MQVDGTVRDSLRVLLVSRRSAPAHGGVESYLRYVSRGLALKHDVTLLTQRIDDGPSDRLTDSLRPPPSFEPFDDEGVTVLPLRFTRAQRLRMTPDVGQVVPVVRRYAYGRLRIPMAMSYVRVAAPVIAERARNADVIHAWADGFVALAAVRAAASVGLPVLITPFPHRDQWGTDLVSVRAYRGADRTVGLLEDNCALLRESGAPTDRVVECPVCSPGVERGGGDAWRRAHGIAGPLVAFLGVRRSYKGFDLLLAALPELARSLPSATVVFAGPGDPVDEQQPLRVIDRGTVSNQERAALLEAADLLCLPSAGEIYPVSILEAWSAETPVLTSDIAPLAELMRRSGGGVTAPRQPESIAAGITSILNGRPHELGAAGYRYWRTYATVDAVVDRHVELYREVIGEHTRAGATR
jgi:glycosyltransferase involved in cell wall biosynthesis